MNRLFLIIIVGIFFVWPVDARAAEIYLKNGDRISGKIIAQDEEAVSLESEALGTVFIKRNSIARIGGLPEAETAETAAAGPPEDERKIRWTREASVGYNTSSGNTETDQFSAQLFINRNVVHHNEITMKGNIYYSRTDDEADAQKWYGLGRYAFSFGPQKHFYNFYRLEYDHDRFANIGCRLTPAAGIGYWFFDLPKLKLLAESGIGFEHTVYRRDKDDTNEVIMTPRAFGEVQLLERVKASGDIYAYPEVGFEEYRLHSEAAVSFAINKLLSLRLSLIDDYNSDPPDDVEKNDVRFESSLTASF